MSSSPVSNDQTGGLSSTIEPKPDGTVTTRVAEERVSDRPRQSRIKLAGVSLATTRVWTSARRRRMLREMSPRRPRASGQSRQKIAQRLRERRTKEEILMLDVAEALARRNAAEAAVADAMASLSTALDELKRLGFDVDEVAELLQVSRAELTGTGTARHPQKETHTSDQT
jgi:PAS domain-containing protein